MGDVDFGKVVVSVSGLHKGSELVMVTFVDGSVFHMQHFQDCCEMVELEDVDGDVSDLIGGLWLGHEESSKNNHSLDDGIGMWTFYTLRTSKGTVWLRWYGSSNGYYSVGVSCGYAESESKIDRW